MISGRIFKKKKGLSYLKGRGFMARHTTRG